jgi:integrase/recombinase XerD
MRKSLRLRDWQRAQDLVRQWEADGQRVEKPKPLTVKEACDAARKKLEALRTFFRFVHESGWISTNPASHLKPPRITEPPTAPFTREEVVSILSACEIYPDKANAVRLRALVFLLRYSGLRIRDAIMLSRNRIQDDKLFLYTRRLALRFIARSLHLL